MTAFTLEATDGAARAGVLHTAHGDVATPAFMPVGTKATVKTVDPDELRALTAELGRIREHELAAPPDAERDAALAQRIHEWFHAA